MSFYGQCGKCGGDLDEAWRSDTGECRMQCYDCGFNEHDYDWDEIQHKG